METQVVTEQKEQTFGEGTILRTSWGYDMTINDYCKIVAVSPTGKTVQCQMIGKKYVEGDSMTGSVIADAEYTEGKIFRLHVRKSGDSLYFVGKYPYCGDHMKSGGFWLWNGQPNYENHMD